MCQVIEELEDYLAIETNRSCRSINSFHHMTRERLGTFSFFSHSFLSFPSRESGYRGSKFAIRIDGAQLRRLLGHGWREFTGCSNRSENKLFVVKVQPLAYPIPETYGEEDISVHCVVDNIGVLNIEVNNFPHCKNLSQLTNIRFVWALSVI